MEIYGNLTNRSSIKSEKSKKKSLKYQKKYFSSDFMERFRLLVVHTGPVRKFPIYGKISYAHQCHWVGGVDVFENLNSIENINIPILITFITINQSFLVIKSMLKRANLNCSNDSCTVSFNSKS